MFSWCWFELMINCSSTLCFLPTSSIFRKISICGLHYCWLQLLSCLGLVFVDLQSIYSTVAVRRNAGSANSVPGFCFCQVSNLAHSWCADVYIHVYPVFAPKKRPSSRVSSVFVRHVVFLFAFLFRIAQCMTQTCEDHCDLWVLWSSLYVNCALVTGKVFKRQQKPELAPVV